MKRLLVRLGAVLFACLAHGEWEGWPGRPVLERLAPPQAWRWESPLSFAQNPVTAEIVVGDSRQIVVFDGASWRAHGRTDHYRGFRALAFGRDGRTLWAGGSNDLGFFQRDGQGNYHYFSLKPYLAADQAGIDEVWLCRPTANGADFVCRQKILRWDGARFHAWSFPTAQRLFPCVVDGDLWFTHPESGLYRMGTAGPEQFAPTSRLPGSAPIAITRERGELIAWSSQGMFQLRAEGAPSNLGAPEFNAACSASAPTSVSDLGQGYTAVGTTDGLLIVGASGRLATRIPPAELGGANGIIALFRDREDWLWIAAENQIFRLPASGGPAHLAYSLQGATPGRAAVASDATHVWLLAPRELLTVRHDQGVPRSREIEITAIGPGSLINLMRWHDGVLSTNFRQIGRTGADQAANPLDLPARSPWGPQRLNPGDDLIATLEPHRVVLFRAQRDGTKPVREIARSGLAPSSLAIDGTGRIWLGELNGHATRHQFAGDAVEETTPPELAAITDRTASFVLRARNALWIVQRARSWVALPDGKLQPAPLRLPAGVVHATVSPSGRQIYVALDRSAQGTQTPQGLGIIELDEQGAYRGWREPWVPGLQVLGGIISLHATAEPDGSDRLWVAGPQGALHFRTATLASWPRPSAPLLTHFTQPGGDPLRLPAHGHVVTLRVQSPEIARRPELRFETRLVLDGEGEWSGPSTQDTLKFSNLTGGDYRFEARTVNPAGVASEAVTFSFAVLPPWYRSGWAYVGCGVLGIGAMAAAARYRERRSRARNAELEHLVTLRTAELETANAAKDEFLASMSHEIRNPMNGVVGLSASIDTAPLDPEARRRFELLRHCAAHLSTLLEDILDFSRLQSGHIELHEAPFAPADLMRSIVALTAAESQAAGRKVATALAPQTPAQLVGDARRLRQVLLNFVSNALKYAARGDVEVSAWTHPLDERRVEFTFAVADHGPGIPADEQPKIFAKFERGSAARRARIPGTGMGLAVCRTLAERMGGRVWLESELGAGSTFYCAVPLVVAASDHSAAAKPAASLTTPSRRTALVVDDEDYNRIAHAALLERLGFAVDVAATGAAARERALADDFDVILIDYDLPDLSGPALARQLRARQPRPRNTPFLLAVTAYSTVEKRAECLAAGLDAFLSKPLAPDRLHAALAPLLPGSPGPDAGADLRAPEDNLRVLAGHSGRTVEEERARYAREFAAESAQLHEAIADRDAGRAARLAHQLAARFAFLHDRSSAELALALERDCREQRWESGAGIARDLDAAAQLLRTQLNRPADPDA